MEHTIPPSRGGAAAADTVSRTYPQSLSDDLSHETAPASAAQC